MMYFVLLIIIVIFILLCLRSYVNMCEIELQGTVPSFVAFAFHVDAPEMWILIAMT